MAGSSGSLRETYASPADSWAFVPVSSSSSNSSTGNPTTSGTTWSRPTSSRSHVFDLTPAPFDDFGTVLLDNSEGRDWGKLISNTLVAGVLTYASTAVVMPFEVAKVLLQVQWIPKEEVADALDPPEELPGTAEEAIEDDTMSETSSSSYFRDPSTLEPPTKFEPSSRALVTDEEGYPIHRSPSDSITRPSYIIPAGPSDGVWGMIRRVAGWKTEGYLSLWKGQLTATILDVMVSSLQPAILSFFYSFQTLPDPIPPPYSLGTLIVPVLSHTVAAHLLSPLDLLRTRLICQPANAPSISLPISLFPFTPLRHLIAREGGLYATYTHPQLLIPSLLDNTIRPLLSLSAPIVINHYTGLDAEANPILFGVAELTWSIASLIITLPIETVRRRLQLQSRAVGLAGAHPDDWRTAACVETRPIPYIGVVDCFYRILTEERSLPVKRKKRRRSSVSKPKDLNAAPQKSWSILQDTGIGQLYRGFSIGVSANVLVFILGAVAGERTEREGWTEL
ncbi:hypothetical protein FRB90_012498 [Tulasnella sp. 427]|nr:hypothetical protein FRB90_012498 [Tulasnella sp. 427]